MAQTQVASVFIPSALAHLRAALEKGQQCFTESLWASLVAQTVKNLPAMRETWDQFLGQEDPLEKGMAIPFSILAWRSPMDQGA